MTQTEDTCSCASVPLEELDALVEGLMAMAEGSRLAGSALDGDAALVLSCSAWAMRATATRLRLYRATVEMVASNDDKDSDTESGQ